MTSISFKHASATAKVNMAEEKLGFVNSVYATIRRQGHATALMEKIVAWADAEGVTLLITAQAYGRGDILENQKLGEFYGRLGFEKQPDSAPWPLHMIRHPSQDLHAP